jgi:hypothetical protein
MIAGSKRTNSHFSLVALTLSREGSSTDVIDLAHSISISMRREDLCGRLGRFEFVVALAGDLNAGRELSQRIEKSSNPQFSAHVVQWRALESSLDLFYRLDTLSQSLE